MDVLGPRLRHVAKPAQLDRPRFQLEWVLPLEPGLSTHVRRFDMECFPPYAVAAREGPDEPDALLALWTALNRQHDSADAMAVVAEAYSRRTGRFPEQIDNASPDQKR